MLCPHIWGRGFLSGLLVLIVSSVFILSGCGDTGPSTPNLDLRDGIVQSTNDGHHQTLWGLYEFHISADHASWDVVPVRGAAFHVNALGFMQSSDPTAVSVDNISIEEDGTVFATVFLKHPFPEFKRYTGFDVQGIMMTPDNIYFPEHDLTVGSRYAGDTALLNPDGFTRRFNPKEWSAFPFPFKYFDGVLIKQGYGEQIETQVNPFRAYWTDSPYRRPFKAGSEIGRVYHCSFRPGPQIFGYAVGASWGEPTKKLDTNGEPKEIPESFQLTANSIEPFNVQVTGSTGGLNSSLGIWAGGAIALSVLVEDWQGNAWVGHENFNVEAPDLFDGVAHSWTGNGSNESFYYEVILPNIKKKTPGDVPILISVTTSDEDEFYLPDTPLASYMLETLEVTEIPPPFCNGMTAIPDVYGGSFSLNGSPGAMHLDASFLPAITGGAGALFFDGGILGGNELIQVAQIPPTGGAVSTTTLFQRQGSLAGNALVMQTNEYNGHLLVVTDADADNLLVYNAAGTQLREYDLGDGEAGRNEPVAMTTNPVNGDIWFVGHRGSQGIFLQRMAYVSGETNFEYVPDPASTVDLGDLLGLNPQVFGVAVNGYYGYVMVFHRANNGSIEVFDINGNTVERLDEFSISNVMGQAVLGTEVPGLRKVIGGDIIVDHVDGDETGACRILVFANTESGSAKLVRLDAWGKILNATGLGSPFSCMALSNLGSSSDRCLVFFPMLGTATYNIWLPPIGEW